MPAHRTFEPALPRLVVGLDQIDPVVFTFCHPKHFMHGARLVDRGGQGALPHPAGARPSEFAQEDLLAGECCHHAPPDGVDMRCSVLGRDGKVFPVRQDMDGDEIDFGGDFAVAQPELPHVRVGDRHRDVRFDVADRAGEVERRHFAAQQDLVPYDHRGDHIGIPRSELERGLDLLAIAIREARQPQPLQHLQSVVLRDLGNPIKSVIDGICPHAIGDRLELRQILLDLPRVDRNIRAERRLVAPEGSVGDAMGLLAWGERRGRHLDRRAQPRPARDNHRRSPEQERARHPRRRNHSANPLANGHPPALIACHSLPQC